MPIKNDFLTIKPITIGANQKCLGRNALLLHNALLVKVDANLV